MKIGIVGLGLIGGSYALSLKKRYEDLSIIGWDNDSEHLEKARSLEIVDQVAESMADLIQQADWIFLAVPVHVIEQELPQLLNKLSVKQVVIDFGSTKETICKVVDKHPKRSQFIAAHPISGTEYSGPEAAFAGLFEDKVMIVCDQSKTDPKLIEQFRKQCKILGMSTSYLSSEDHDIHLAYVSHLSHVISYGLSHTVLRKEESERRILDLAGSGFASTVRLAKSSPEMWTPIFMKNRAAMVEALDAYIQDIVKFKELLKSGDDQGVHSYLEKGREIRKVLE